MKSDEVHYGYVIPTYPMLSHIFKTSEVYNTLSQKQGGGCGSGMALKPSCSQTKGRRPSWPNLIMGDVVRMLVSLSLYQPLTNLIIRALAAV